MKKLVLIITGICIVIGFGLTWLSTLVVKSYSCSSQAGMSLSTVGVNGGQHYCDYDLSSTRLINGNISYKLVLSCSQCESSTPATISSGWPLSFYTLTPLSSDTQVSNSISLTNTASTSYIASIHWRDFTVDVLFWATISSLVSAATIATKVHQRNLKMSHSCNDPRTKF